MDSSRTIERYGDYVMPTYAKYPLAIVRGKGTRVWDADGNEYLDFFPGWAVSGLGHAHPRVVRAVRRQAGVLLHVANNYYHEWQAALAEKIVHHSFPGKVFFANSGAEANEAAFKLARKWGNPTRNEIIAAEGSFHGRTLATVTATGQKKFQEGFEPLPAGFSHVPYNDRVALERAISPKTVAIILEPIQGEGGIRVPDPGYLAAARTPCDREKILLIFDEVQTGMGRTGRLFAYQHFGVEPDMMTVAKSLGGGVPIGALVAKKNIADTLGPGTHATTFGGSPLACAAGLAVFEAIEKEKLLENAIAMGAHLLTKLTELKEKHSIIRAVRGAGLMMGIELAAEGKPVYEACLKNKLLINVTQGNVLRVMPPLVVTKGEIDRAMAIFDGALMGASET